MKLLISWKRMIYQFLMAFLISLSVMSYTMIAAWISPAALLLKSKHTPASYRASDEEISWMASIVPGMGVPGSILYGYALEKFGRKLSLVLLPVPIVLCWVIKLSTEEPWALVLARGIAGLSAGGAYCIPPVYIKEISDDDVRGLLGSFVSLAHCLGYLFGYLLGALCQYRTTLWISVSLPTVLILAYLYVPESPSFLVKNGKYSEAGKVIAWLRNVKETDECVLGELNSLKLKQAEVDPKRSTVNWKLFFGDKTTRKTLILCLMLMNIEVMGGIFPLASYLGIIFDLAKDGSVFFQWFKPNFQTVFVALIQLIGSLIACSLIEYCGRKPLLIVTTLVNFVCLAGLGIWFYLLKEDIRIPGWLPIFFMSTAAFSYSAGLLPVSYVMITEVSEFQIRGTMASIANVYNWVVAFIFIKLFSTFVIYTGVYTVFWIFSVACLLHTFYTIFFIPETKGKSIDVIHGKLCGKSISKVSSTELD